MAEPDHSSPSTSVNRESSGAAATASSSRNASLVSEEDDTHNHIHVHHDHRFRTPEPELEDQNVGFSYRENFSAVDDASAIIRDDTWSCIIIVLTFWFFVSMTLILGVYGAANVMLGPNASILIEANPLFVQTVKVEELNEVKPGPRLYGFYKSPPLDVVTSWSENYSVSLGANSHKEWIHFLNRGSEINISYSVKSPSSSSVFLIIAQGYEGLAQWLEDPAYPNTTLCWNVIHGSGEIHQDIYTSSSYYIALANLNSEEVEVQLNVGVKALLYNTSEAYYQCTFTQGVCSLSILFPKGNAIVLASPGVEKLQSTVTEDWYVRVSYGPRWLTYVVGIGGMTVLMFLAFKFLNKYRWTREYESQFGNIESARAPLLPYKDDDLSSWGSSYDSVSNDEEDLEEFLAASYPEGKSVRDGENGNNTRRLCAICFDAPRDCFFLPCGHCVACFECGTRIAEADGTCPVCRRNMKKVRKIFTV